MPTFGFYSTARATGLESDAYRPSPRLLSHRQPPPSPITGRRAMSARGAPPGSGGAFVAPTPHRAQLDSTESGQTAPAITPTSHRTPPSLEVKKKSISGQRAASEHLALLRALTPAQKAYPPSARADIQARANAMKEAALRKKAAAAALDKLEKEEEKRRNR